MPPLQTLGDKFTLNLNSIAILSQNSALDFFCLDRAVKKFEVAIGLPPEKECLIRARLSEILLLKLGHQKRPFQYHKTISVPANDFDLLAQPSRAFRQSER